MHAAQDISDHVDFAPDRTQLARVAPPAAPPAWAAAIAIAVALGLGLSLALPPAAIVQHGNVSLTCGKTGAVAAPH